MRGMRGVPSAAAVSAPDLRSLFSLSHHKKCELCTRSLVQLRIVPIQGLKSILTADFDFIDTCGL